mgnify:CR=1 FL=1
MRDKALINYREVLSFPEIPHHLALEEIRARIRTLLSHNAPNQLPAEEDFSQLNQKKNVS